MGGGWPVACLVLAALVADLRGEDERWSRPATPERRQGDWVPLTCANCRPVLDQNVQSSDNLPSVLTPPPRAEEARLLAPPPPPDGILQTAASGFLPAFTQQQPPRHHKQFLQETTAQSINRPHAQFLRANNPIVSNKPPQPFLREPSQEFQPPQEPRPNRQPQLLQFNHQQFVSDQPYLNQPLLLGPQFLSSPFFPQTSIPPQNIQQINPLQFQPQNPIAPNVSPLNSQAFQLPPDRPSFTQQITAGAPELQALPQPIAQTEAPQQFSVNDTDSQRDEGEKEEVQLLYVPVETLNQRAREKAKSIPTNQQGGLNQQAVGTGGNRFAEQSFESSTSNSLIDFQGGFNIQTETSKPQYNTKQNNQFQQQLPPVDQEKFNTQTHTVRQQFVKQNDELQQPALGTSENIKLDSQNNKQYNFKAINQFQTQSQFQPQVTNFNPQFQQSAQFSNQDGFQSFGNVPVQGQNTRQQFDIVSQPQQDNVNFNGQPFNNNNQQFRTPEFGNVFQQQQFPPLGQQNINTQPLANTQQFNANQNLQLQQQFQQPFSTFRDQDFLNRGTPTQQPQQVQQVQAQNQLQQQHFALPEEQRQTIAPVAQTPLPDTTNTQKTEEQQFKTPQQDLRNLQQVRSNQFTRKFPQDYQQFPTSSSPSQATEASVQEKENDFNQQRTVSQQQPQISSSTPLYNSPHQLSTLTPTSSTLRQPHTTLAPNQPPLSVYMETTEESKVNDVLRLLKNAKTIQVLDTVGPESPQVFVGPSNLKAPAGYFKFELPYLNTLDSNRVERKVDQLPFFVAPLNFNPPPGYSKIPFPSPHIGSVVVSNVTVLRTALHEKQYENAPVPSSTTEQYLNQYTLPGSISPISPQLPSLVNSLRDDIYFGSSTATFPSTTTESTTVAYTTPTYRGRGSNRGAQRGSSNYTPSASNTATRRPQPRTRRPYSRRQPVTTTTTTEEPTTEITTQQSLTPVPEQIAFNSETYHVQNTETPSHLQAREPSQSENQNLNFESNNGNSYYNEQFVANTFNQDFAPQQQHNNLNQNIQQFAVTGRPINNEQFHHSVVPSQNEHNVEEFQQTTASPSIATGNFQQDDYSLKNQRNNLRRDPARQHQRFRSRQRLTTTTEIYEQPPPATDNQFYSQAGDRQHYKNLQTNNQGIHNQKLVENTHFEANVPQNQYNIQTERSDFDFQTTERLISRPSEEQNVNDNHSNSQFNPNSQYDQTQFRQNLGSDQQILTNYHDQFHREIFSNQNLEHNQQVPISQTNSQTQYSHQINQKDQFQSTSPPNVDTQENLNQYVNAGHSRGQIEQNHFNQQSHQEIQQQNDHQGLHQQQFQGSPVHVDNTNQRHQTSTLGQLEQVSEIITTTPQEAFTQTTEPSTPQSQQDEYQQQQYNQQRLKYNRPSSRTPITGDSEEHKRGHQHFHNNADTTDTTTTDDITTRASLVRVRGRVRSKQRGSVRQSTTTEEPNYPSSYLHRQKINHENEENKDYNFKKRPSFNSRQTYSSLKNSNKVAISDQNGDENKPNIESQSNAEGSVDYNEGSTTTTEISAQTPTRRYQHILNRNKVRRVRPTGAPSESSGTTRFLRPTTQPPITRLPSSTRGRIRKPVSNKSVISTTEYSQVKPGLDERENFAPSAGSNEIIEPLYQTREKAQPSFGFQRDSHPKTSPKPSFSSDDGEFWNQGVTIQQSTSFDYRPEAVTPPSFKESEEIQGTMSPIWNGQVELQDGNYYDAFNQRHVSRNDQTPFSSDQQKIVYKDIKGRQPVGKENQYPEKNYEEKQQTDPNEEDITPKIYPVYREVANPPEAVEDETTPEVRGDYETQNNNFDEKPNGDAFVRYNKKVLHEDSLNSEVEDGEVKEGALKRKIIATHPGKKGGRRRGSWVRVRVRKPQDMFEAAESQNLGRFSENAIQEVTKTTSEKVWSPEPVTEALLTTTTKEVRNPAQTITFEQALKDMLKEFITNPGDTQEPGNEQEETEAEASTDWPDVAQPTNTTEGAKEVIPSEVQLQETVVKMLQDSEDAKSKTPEEETIVQEDKDVGKTTAPEPELTTEVFTQEPTTFVQVVEDAETTVEPEVSTSTEAPKYPQSRVLGTSTTTEISLETEICYRGRCVKTKKVDAESDLLPME